jgi:alkanesulfonate monooxygenase SsuD/methylene tetrahydromethanopterin reductase-like flavin-dependent oxidoreductase (luciferase family)
MTRIPLAVLDLIPRSEGATIAEGVRNAIDLAQQAERFGYQRYWFAEHHLNPGVLGAAPALSIALVGATTNTIRLGSAGVQTGNRTPLSIVEEFGLLDAVYPGRLDLGIGRSFSRPRPGAESGAPVSGPAQRELVAAAVSNYQTRAGQADHSTQQQAGNGCRGLDSRCFWRRECLRRRRERAAVRRLLPPQSQHRPGRRECLPCRLPAVGRGASPLRVGVR